MGQTVSVIFGLPPSSYGTVSDPRAYFGASRGMVLCLFWEMLPTVVQLNCSSNKDLSIAFEVMVLGHHP